MIETDSVFAVQLSGSERAEIGMSLPDFAEEELDINSQMAKQRLQHS